MRRSFPILINQKTDVKSMDTAITVIGAGVIGLAIAEVISENHEDVYVLEKHSTFGQETSSRNSEVIHAGIYYPEGSMKARMCVEGRDLLYDYCRKHDVPFKNCGKLIVATTPEEIEVIKEIRERALKNNVGLTLLEKAQVKELEPDIFALKALLSPTTGIIDSHALMKRFETNFLNNGGKIAYGSEVTGIKKIPGGYEIIIYDSDAREYSFTSSYVINSAGLTADKISEMTGIRDSRLSIHFCKGEYFRIIPPKNRLLKRLIYPLPHKNMEGIGIHVTIDMGGGVKLGPDVTYMDSNKYDYTVNPFKQEVFWKSARKFLPFLGYDDIAPDMAGIRPKTQKHGDPIHDFYIMEESARGYKGFINLIGMESPGLTSCISIARHVNGLIVTNQ